MSHLPLGWVRAKVGDLCEAHNGRAFKSTEWVSAGLPIIRITNLKDAGEPFNYFRGKLEEQHRVRPGDLLFAWSGTPGTSFGAHIWNGPEAALNQHIFNIRFRHDRINRKFLCYALNQNVARYVAEAQGGVGLAHITKSKFMASEIPFPPMSEQGRISDALDSYVTRLDDAVTSLERVQAKLKAYRASVLKAAVEGRLAPTEASLALAERRSYEPANALLARILKERRRRWEEAELARLTTRGKAPKDDRWKSNYEEPAPPDTIGLPKLPEGWCWASVDQVAEETLIGLVRGRREQRGTPPGYPYLKMNAIGPDGSLNVQDFVYVDANQADVARYSVRTNDSLFNTRNSVELVGKAALVPCGVDGRLFNNNIMRMRVSVGLAPAFIALQMASLPFRERLEKIKRATTSVAAIYQKDLFPQALAIPPVAEQERISEVAAVLLSTQQTTDSVVVHQMRRIARMRQSVLKWAFEGRLVEQDPTDEPAQKVLARICAEDAAVSTGNGRRARGAA